MEDYVEKLTSKRIKICAVYILQHADGVYIGSSTDMYQRQNVNRSKLKLGQHHCAPLQEAYNKDPRISFKIYATDAHLLFQKEAEFINWCRERGDNVFNQGGDDVRLPTKGLKFGPMTKEAIEKKVETHKAKARRLIADGIEYAGVWEAVQILGLSYSTIYCRCRSPNYPDWQWIA
jgi:hypothetical protein